jgi:S1-C subfamily serine protease
MKNEETKRQPLAPVSILHSSFCLHTFPCGALVDERGNVIGIVSAKLDASTALAMSGSLPENVNYAVKSSLLLSFLESVPESLRTATKPSSNRRTRRMKSLRMW